MFVRILGTQHPRRQGPQLARKVPRLHDVYTHTHRKQREGRESKNIYKRSEASEEEGGKKNKDVLASPAFLKESFAMASIFLDTLSI